MNIYLDIENPHLKNLIKSSINHQDGGGNDEQTFFRLYNHDNKTLSFYNKDEKIRDFPLPVRIGEVIDTLQKYHDRQIIGKTDPIPIGKFIFYPFDLLLEKPKTKEKIPLTEKERDLLWLFYKNKGTALSKQTLLGEIWHYAQNVETHTLETHIYRLRQKIEDDAAAPSFLMKNDDGYFLTD